MINQKNLDEAVYDVAQISSHDNAASSFAPVSDWSEMNSCEHFAQFYETDVFLLNSLAGFVTRGLTTGEAVVVVATKSHRDGLEKLLLESGVDLIGARAAGQYLAFDVQTTLEQFVANGSPDPDLFDKTIARIIEKAGKGRSGVRVFGEMVTLLWNQGNCEAALRTEELWNRLQQTHPFLLFCAYPISGFAGEAFSLPLVDVCAAHSRVIPAESYISLPSAENRLRAILQLQQKARALQAEIAERKQAERALRNLKDELEMQVEDLRQLHEMNINLASSLDIDSLLREVLRAAMAVHKTDLGLLSLCDPECEGLSVKVQCGFDEEFLKQIECVQTGAGACGACYKERRRIVVEDVESSPIFASHQHIARAGSFRACHSTPLITRIGTIIGVLSVHFRQPHRPSERESRLMDLYARMASDFIESARLHHQLQQQLEMREQLLSREQIARVDAENANRMKDEFLATVSHELRTPLNAIVGWSHMLRTRRLDETTTERALATIDRNAKAQAQLVEDILDVSRVITGKLRLTMAQVDIAAVINAAIDSVQLAAESKGIELAVTLDPSARHILGDASRLQQVVWNLLSNAIKFTGRGGLIAVKLARADGAVQILVSDTGHGIKPEVLPFIFDRFRQADGSTTRQHGGLGLGLAIVRHLVELHGGTVHVDSAGEGLGSMFTVKLPPTDQAKTSRSQKAEPKALYGVNAKTESAKSVPSLEHVRILVVDDDWDTLQVLTVMLREQKANVHAATSAAEAFEALQWYKPDVVVSDLAMPGEDGYSLIRKIRSAEDEGLRSIPVVALTAYVRIEDRARALSAGFSMFVPKPVEPNELITAIANLAEIRECQFWL